MAGKLIETIAKTGAAEGLAGVAAAAPSPRPRNKPAAPAARSTQIEFSLAMPAAAASAAMSHAAGVRITFRAMLHPALKMRAITTGPSPATTPCNAVRLEI